MQWGVVWGGLFVLRYVLMSLNLLNVAQRFASTLKGIFAGWISDMKSFKNFALPVVYWVILSAIVGTQQWRLRRRWETFRMGYFYVDLKRSINRMEMGDLHNGTSFAIMICNRWV